MLRFVFKRYFTHLCVLLCFSGAQISLAQRVQLEFYSTENGLAGNNTSCVTQDDRGFIWFINEGKLHRHDGIDFLELSVPQNIRKHQEPLIGISACNDSLLFIWSNRSAFLFDPLRNNWMEVLVDKASLPESETFWWHRMSLNHIILNRGRKGLMEAAITKYENGLLKTLNLPERYSKLKNHLSNSDSYFLNYWCDIDENGNTVLLYRDTLFVIDGEGREQGAYSLSRFCQGCFNLSFQIIDNEKIAIMANWQLFLLNTSSGIIEPHQANGLLQKMNRQLHRFIIDEKGSFWACGNDRTLIYYNTQKDTLINYRPQILELLKSPNDFKSILKDRSGVLWIETRLGLLKVTPQPFPFSTHFGGINNAESYYSFRGLTEDEDGEVYGVFYSGIAKLKTKTNREVYYTFDNAINLFDLHLYKGRIWANAGQYLSLSEARLVDVESPFFENTVEDNGFFAEDNEGNLWWAARNEFFRLSILSDRYSWEKRIELPFENQYSFMAFANGSFSGNLWCGVNGYVLKIDPKTLEKEDIDLASYGLRSTAVMAIYEDKEANLWLGTDIGLVCLDLDKKQAMRYTINEGLPNNYVCGLLNEGDSALWLSTNHGLSRFQIQKQEFINFYEDDGLSHNEFNRKSYFKSSDGRMWFGGMRGVTSFYPEELMAAYRKKKNEATLLLTAFEYSDEELDSTFTERLFKRHPRIDLYNHNWAYTFKYVLTDYSNPKEVMYKYKLDGYKDSWSNPSPLNVARFNDLPDGEYTFKVKARDSRGRWHPDELSVKVKVHPPWWRSTIAYFGYVLLLLFGLGIFSNFRERFLLRRQVVLKRIVELRTKQLEEEKITAENERHRTDKLLLNILPKAVAEELKTTGQSVARYYREATVMFTDFSEFTKYAESWSPTDLVSEVDACFIAFDEIVSKYNIEKIKTIGDAYMCAGGLNNEGQGKPCDVILAATEMQAFMQEHRRARALNGFPSFEMRIGIHTGPVVAGIVGVKKFQYDIWGDTVNTASRMENHSQINKINISEATYHILKNDSRFEFTSRGRINVKGKGVMNMWFIDRKKT